MSHPAENDARCACAPGPFGTCDMCIARMKAADPDWFRAFDGYNEIGAMG